MRLHPRSIDLGLGRIERVLKRLGSPEKKLPPIVHVAGTNGKGSLVAYLRAMAEAAGYRAHVFTGPHLVRFNERIRVAGQLIDDAVLDEVLTECEEANGEQPITFFEITTAAAYLAFSRIPADIALIDGLGGRYTRTNVIDPALSRSRRSATPQWAFGDKLEGTQAKGRHPEARRACRDRPPARGERPVIAARLRRSPSCSAWSHGAAPTAGFRYESDLLTLDLPAPALIRGATSSTMPRRPSRIECLRAANFDRRRPSASVASVDWPAGCRS